MPRPHPPAVAPDLVYLGVPHGVEGEANVDLSRLTLADGISGATPETPGQTATRRSSPA